MKRIGIIAALPAELKPLVRSWKQVRSSHGEGVWQGSLDGVGCVAVCSGMGQDAAERACELAARHEPLDALISVGWAGALSCGMHPGEAYHLNEVMDAASGEKFTTQAPPRVGNAGPLRIVTIDHVALSPEKKQLGETFQAVLVDMEAASVARFAARRGIDFYCLKAVSDVAGQRLPDFSRYTDRQGHFELGRFLAYVALRPQYWPSLARLDKNGKAGAVSIAAALVPLVTSSQTRGEAEVYRR
jgi:adenosylhomocysteine nucleosidase